MNEIQTFNNEEFGQVRTVEIDGDPWFLGTDIAAALQYADKNKAVSMHVEAEDRKTLNYKASDKTTEALWNRTNDFSDKVLINESGLYSLIMSSKLPSAKRFKHWVTSEVLPSIRKTGGYQMPQTYAEALRALADKAEEAERLSIENSEMKPKADFFDAVTDSKDAIPIGDVAKVLDAGIGRNKLFEFLRNSGILMQDNRPYQKFIDAGYFRVIEQKYDKGYGETGINIKTLAFQKGVDYIRKRLEATAQL